MEVTNADGTSVLLSGDQQIVLSAEDAAQLLAQAGIQIGENEQVIIGTQNGQQTARVVSAAEVAAAQSQAGQQVMEAALSAAGQTVEQTAEQVRHAFYDGVDAYVLKDPQF
jgi:hypothetical protein